MFSRPEVLTPTGRYNPITKQRTPESLDMSNALRSHIKVILWDPALQSAGTSPCWPLSLPGPPLLQQLISTGGGGRIRCAANTQSGNKIWGPCWKKKTCMMCFKENGKLRISICSNVSHLNNGSAIIEQHC